MAKTPKVEGQVKVRLLRDSEYGSADAVVEMDASLAQTLAGVVDADPAAVAYAESLTK